MKKVYSSSYRCNISIWISTIELIKQAIEYKWQILLSIKKNIKSTYQQDIFALFWSIVMPIIPMTVYIVLAQIKVLKTVDTMPFIYYIAAGMLTWLLMATTIHAVLLSIKSEKAILQTTSMPLFVAMLSKFGEVINDTIIRIIMLIFIMLYLGINIHFYSIFLAILVLIPAIIFALSLGMILSIIDLAIQDIRRITILVLRYGLFISSVIFPFPDTGIPGMINTFNFFNTYVNAVRDVLFFGSIEHLQVYLYTSVVAIILFLIAAKLVYSMDYKVRAFL